MTTLEANWGPVKQVILGEDPQMRVYGEISAWFKKLDLFRKGEHERMFLHEPDPEDLAVHKSLIQRLIADGDHLRLLVQQVGMPQDIQGISPSDLTAAIESLRDTYRGWHEPLSPERRAQILHEVFPDVA